jgi:hypothetical protein
MDLTDFERGFIAGLLISAGSFSGDGATPSLGVKLQADDPEPLATLSRLLGGTIYGPYQHGSRRYAYWLLRGRPLADALPLFDAILPPCRKREQYLAWKRRYGFPAPASGAGHSGGVDQLDL